MDYLLLLLVWKMLSCSATHGSVCIGAMIGSAFTCVVMVLPIPYAAVKLLLYHAVINSCMIRVGLKIKHFRTFVKAFLLLYVGSILMGGIMELMGRYATYGSLFLFAAIGGYYLVLAIWKFMAYLQRWKQHHCEVEICMMDKLVRVKGFLDSGNQLHDPMSGKPVSVLDKTIATEMLVETKLENTRYIPYRTIGERERVMLIFVAEKMNVYAERKYTIERPIIGISEERISASGEYEILLNPNIF
jgi:stage II sporulation protein GA (sporulation sigma-E factor processing peptidase)